MDKNIKGLEDFIFLNKSCFTMDLKNKDENSLTVDELCEHTVIDVANLTDGYHSFSQLYDFRMQYNAAFFNMLANYTPYRVIKSARHSDGNLCFGGGWFIVVAQLPTGQISNHYENKYWHLFRCECVDQADEWDGHTDEDVLSRLEQFNLKFGEFSC